MNSFDSMWWIYLMVENSLNVSHQIGDGGLYIGYKFCISRSYIRSAPSVYTEFSAPSVYYTELSYRPSLLVIDIADLDLTSQNAKHCSDSSLWRSKLRKAWVRRAMDLGYVSCNISEGIRSARPKLCSYSCPCSWLFACCCCIVSTCLSLFATACLLHPFSNSNTFILVINITWTLNYQQLPAGHLCCQLRCVHHDPS